MVSTAIRHKLNTRPYVDPLVVLVEIQEDGSTIVHRAAAHDIDVTREGEIYSKSDISVTLPRGGDAETSSRITMSNVDRIASQAAAAATRRIGVRLILVNESDPDITVKFDTRNLLMLKNITANIKELSGNLSPKISMNEPYPPRPTTKQGFPGIWVVR